MKLLLVHAYHLALDEAERAVMKPYPPLGPLYLSAYLKEQGHEVQVYDGTFQRPEDFTTRLAHFKPEVVGFYANMMTRHQVLRLRREIRDPKIRVVVGGPDPPYYAESYLERGFEVVIAGEGERPFSSWLEHIDDPDHWPSIEGLIFHREGQVVRTAPQKPNLSLDRLPLPDRKAIDLEAYLNCWERHHGARPISLITSRGCPYRCTWCSHNVFGYSLRKRSPQHVLQELEWLRRHYRFDHYWFADDVFTIKHPWLFEMRDLLRAHPDLALPFECISRADRLTPEIVAALREMRCARLWVGAESGSQRLLDLMQRGVTREQVIQAIGWLKAAGIETGMFFMWGFMDEGFQDVLDTVSLVEACAPDTALTTLAYPIKGTVFHQALADGGQLGDDPPFEAGTDRNIPIRSQPARPLYDLANRMLHSALQRRRPRRGPIHRLKGLAHHARYHYCRQRLKRGFARHPIGNNRTDLESSPQS